MLTAEAKGVAMRAKRARRKETMLKMSEECLRSSGTKVPVTTVMMKRHIAENSLNIVSQPALLIVIWRGHKSSSGVGVRIGVCLLVPSHVLILLASRLK